MKFNEFLVAGMSTFLDDQPEALAAYTAYWQLAADPVLWEKIKARERFLKDRWLDRAEAYAEGRAEGLKQAGVDPVRIAEITGLSLLDIERLR